MKIIQAWMCRVKIVKLLKKKILQTELYNTREWLTDEMLSLHLGKAEPILFGTNQKLKNLKFEIESGGQILKGKSSLKYFEVELDQTLSGSGQSTKLISKIKNKLQFPCRNSNTVWVLIQQLKNFKV